MLHYADIQIEVRTSGTGAQRYDEFARGLQDIEAVAQRMQPDIIVIPGDIFEFQDANAEELKLFTQHLHAILPTCKRVIIIPGNHDVRQRGIALTTSTEKRNLTDAIDLAVTAVKSPKISYYQKTGLYEDTTFDITWAVWSQWTKHSMADVKPAYSPWVDNDIKSVKTSSVIELFHDPVMGCKHFDGQPSKHFENYKITMADFQAPTVLAGDIHAPDIVRDGDKTFTYCSSLVQRNFGEGDYYDGHKLTVKGNCQHGYNILTFDTDINRVVDIEFFSLNQVVSRHTIYLSDKFDYETMTALLSIEATELNKIRLVCKSGLSEFTKNEEALVRHFKSKYTCSVETDWAKDVLSVEVDTTEYADLSQIVDKDKMLKISKKYIDTIVKQSTTIETEDREASAAMIYEMFEEQLLAADLTNKKLSIDIIGGTVSNFMSFTKDVQIRFGNAPITKITGANGVGKTKLFDFLKWMTKDQISSSQNLRNKRYNYALYFNDHSEADTVSGELKFIVNGKPHKLVKTLTRSWKKGKKDIFAKNWIDNLSGTPTMSLTLTSSNLTTDNTQEVVEYMDSLFTFQELEQLVFINSFSFDRLINMKPEDLSARFLNIIGLDAMTDLLGQIEDVKAAKLGPLAKPAMTVNQIVEQIAQIETKAQTLEHDTKAKRSEAEAIETEVDAKTKDTNGLRSKLHQVDKTHIIDAQIEVINANVARRQDTITEKQARLDLLLATKDSMSIDKLKDGSHALELKLVNARHKVEQSEQRAESIRQTIDAKKSDAVLIVKDVTFELNSEIAIQEKSISAKRELILELKGKKSAHVASWLNEVQRSKNAVDELLNKSITVGSGLNDALSAIKIVAAEVAMAKKTITEKIERAEKKVADLVTSKVCLTCKQTKSKSAQEAIDKQIVTVKKSIVDQEAEMLLLGGKVDTIKADWSQCQTKIELNKAIQAEHNKESIKLKALLLGETVPNISEWQQAFAMGQAITKELADQSEQLETLTAEVVHFGAELGAKLKQHDRVIEAKSQIVKVTQELEEHKGSEALLKQAVIDIKIDMAKIEAKLAELATIDDNIQELNDAVKLHLVDNEKERGTQQLLTQRLRWSIENKETQLKIDTQDRLLGDMKEQARSVNETLAAFAQEKASGIQQVEILNGKIGEVRQWRLVESSLKLYKRLLGKHGLPQYIFAHIVGLINTKLNESLEGVDFRLQFDQDTLELKFIDLKQDVMRPVQFVSGMQTTVIALALINIMRQLNGSKQFNVLMIDEISGKLNDGKDLTYEARNYKELVQQFIATISKGCQVVIVDHTLTFKDSKVIEVFPDTGGSNLKYRK